MSAEIITLDQVSDATAGGKAYGLMQLVTMGLNVPPAFVIRAAAHNDFPPLLEQYYAQMGAGNVAVRSSALGEDGSDASFAGQYDTVLNVCGIDALHRAINQCVASADSEHASSYKGSQQRNTDTAMNIVVQRMVPAQVAGVVFTADAVSGRRDLLVVDAVAGLGEALVSGAATPDHYAINTRGEVVRRELCSTEPLLSDPQLSELACLARDAADKAGHPLDLEWAIDADGTLFWLQARPITTLPADLNAMDTRLPRPDDVLTISNISEMMPGAVCPLTDSFTGWGIDYGLQHMQVRVGTRAAIDPSWQLTASAYGHLFLNLTGSVTMSAGVLGSTVDQTAQTLCGRIVPELKGFPDQPLWRRILNTTRLLRFALSAPSAVRRFDKELEAFVIEPRSDSRAMWQEIQDKSEFFNHTMAVHIQSSALSGFLNAVVENMVSGRANESTTSEQGAATRLLAGASGVESAVMLEQLDALIDEVAAHPDAAAEFAAQQPGLALSWVQTTAPLSSSFEAFLEHHGHRGYRELCMRDPAWRDDPAPLIQSMQAAVRARQADSQQRQINHTQIDWASLDRGLRWALPRAHDAIRRREHTKSRLVEVAYRFKQAFRQLGELLAAEGTLPDADLVHFFAFHELPDVVAHPGTAAAELAAARRESLGYQQRLEFPEISVGPPQPLEASSMVDADGQLQGRPASCGVVEGIARVAHTLDEAAALQPGEILVTPITDIGWTPYFSLIGGLVTDLGSSVSHGAVIAREYGLPCVVNTRQATRAFRTGDRLRLDGDTGQITRLEAG